MAVVVPEKSDGGAEGGKRWRREKAAAPEKPELGDSAGERRLRGRKAEMETSAREDRARAGGAKALHGRRVSVSKGTLQAPWERQRPKSGP